MHIDAITSRDIVCALLEQVTPAHFKPHGPSMTPLIRDGDTVRVIPVDPAAARPGHLLLYRKLDRLVLHRMIKRLPGETFLTIADAALEGRETVKAADVLGVAESVRRGRRERRLDSSVARWAGLLRYHARPIRRTAIWLFRRWR